MHDHAIRLLRQQVDAVLRPAMTQSPAGTTQHHQAIIDDLEVSIAALERDAKGERQEDSE